MAGLTGRRRLLLAAAYVGFLVFAVGALVVLQMAYNQAVNRAISIPVVLFHAFPILVVKFFQDLAFGGPDGGGGGYAGLVYFGTVLLQWWPLPAVAVVPRLWVSRAGRVAVKVYLVALAALMIGAAAWLALDPSLLASGASPLRCLAAGLVPLPDSLPSGRARAIVSVSPDSRRVFASGPPVWRNAGGSAKARGAAFRCHHPTHGL